jgi:hypothetical protein
MTGALSPAEVIAALNVGYRHIDAAWKHDTERSLGEAPRQRAAAPRANSRIPNPVERSPAAGARPLADATDWQP